ncbi:MAG: TatD family hydrolase [Planctomycetes bacterium]|nr:TatD family hydrolase [Planctomycetota bacterium]
MDLIDSHAHLTSEALASDVDGVLQRAVDAGVSTVVTISTDAADAEACVRLARLKQGVHCSVGIHPHEAGKVHAGDMDRLRVLADDPNVVAIGELGLDYHYDFSDQSSQKRVLDMQLEWAGQLDLALVVHCREAFEDVSAALLAHGFRDRRVVFHCFTGTADEARRAAQAGWRISFTGIVTFKRSTELQAIARDYPADQLMLETDSPYLSPIPVRSIRPNEPAHLAHTAKFLAELRGISLDEFAAATSANTRAFFGLG